MVARALVLLVVAILALGAGPVLAESPDPGGGSTTAAAGTDTTDAESDGDTSSDADATGVNGSRVIDLVADDFIGTDGEIYFVDDTTLLDGLAAGDRVSFTYEFDDNGEPVILTIEVASDDLGDATEGNGADADADSDPNDGALGADGDDSVNNDDETAGDGTVEGSVGSADLQADDASNEGSDGAGATLDDLGDDGAAASGDDGSESGHTSAATSSAQRHGLRAYNVLRYQVLPKAPEAARPALLRTIQRLADRLGLILDFSDDAAEGDAGALDSAALGLGAGKTKHAEKFADKHGDADAPPSDSETDGDADAPPNDSGTDEDDSSKRDDESPRGRGRGRTL